MKIQRLTQGLVFALLLSLTACTPAKFNTYIIGRWQPQKIGNHDIYPSTLAEDTESKPSSSPDNQALDLLKQSIYDAGKKQKGTTITDIKAQFKKANKESLTTYIFTSPGKGTLVIPGGESMEMTWRFKKGGKLLVINGPGTSYRVKLAIETLTMTTMLIRNKSSLLKGITVTYIKQ
ncbi:MAG: hypothetical protein H8E51_06590 [Bacteroidetes bacterium]|nr:hypothetical protein [Bacteroidota bacterium]